MYASRVRRQVSSPTRASEVARARLGGSLLSLWLLCAVCAPARAQAPSESALHARELFQRGVTLTAEDHFEEAVGAFRESIALHPAPTTSYNLAAALFELGRYVEAHAQLSGLVWPKGSSLEARTRADALTKSLVAKLARLTVSVHGGDAQVELNIDGAPFPARDQAHVIMPGPHLLRVQRGPSALLTRPLELGADTSTIVDVCLLPGEHFVSVAPAPLQKRPEPPNMWRSWQLWTAVGAVVLVSGVAIGAVIASQDDGGGGATSPMTAPLQRW